MSARAQVLVALLASLTAATLHADGWDWDKGEREIVRLNPEELRDVPKKVRQFAADHGCTIPQLIYASRRQTNVVSGEFAGPGQSDWALLCSRNGESSILLLWGGPIRCPSEIARAPDRAYLEGSSSMKDGKVVRRVSYRREIAPGEPPDDSYEYQAIYDEQAKHTNRYFCEGGKWRKEELGFH